MPFTPATLAEHTNLTKVGSVELRLRLDTLASRGLVFRQVKGDVVLYSLYDIFTIYRVFRWPGRIDD